jgi:hypothetical protein
MKDIVHKIKVVLPYLATISLLALIVWSFTGKSYHRSYNPYYGDDGEYAEEPEPECGVYDGTHDADVNYYNPKTGRSSKYSLEVQVEDCKVIQINFPNGGYLDDSHISPTKINWNGDAKVKDDKGIIYKIHIEE